MAILTDEDVIEIRRLVVDGEPQMVVAHRFHVSRQYVNDIVKMRRRTERRVAFDPLP